MSFLVLGEFSLLPAVTDCPIAERADGVIRFIPVATMRIMLQTFNSHRVSYMGVQTQDYEVGVEE
jgi:hypothetical protein